MNIKDSIRFLCFTSIITFATYSCSAVILDSNNKFTTNLYSALANNKENVFFSPISLHAALALIYEGATGECAYILQKVLDLPNADESAILYKEFISDISRNTTFYFATNAFVQKGLTLKWSFQYIANTYFMAEIENVDFTDANAAAEQINSWVQRKTHNNIKEIILADAIERETLLVVANALYFKGHWKYPFPEKHTKVENFYISDTDTVACNMMHITKPYRYSKNAELNAQILEIPYIENQMKLIIILPNSISGMRILEEKLVKENLRSFLQYMSLGSVVLSLPKFKLEISMDLSDPLKELGLGHIFSQEAEFSNLVESEEPLRVSSVIQKTFLTINEIGTEASAATGVSIRSRRSAETFQYKFEANRPFLFYVIDSNSNIIFFGKLMKPNPVVLHDEL